MRERLILLLSVAMSRLRSEGSEQSRVEESERNTAGEDPWHALAAAIAGLNRAMRSVLRRFYFSRFTTTPMGSYSYRKATSGSTPAARRAGIQQATMPTISNKSGTHTNVHGSHGAAPH